jgi:hypothetical protein
MCLDLKLQSHRHPGRAPLDVRGDPGTTRALPETNRGTSVTLLATSGMIREDLAFDPGWNKIFNITGVDQDDPGRKALLASSLALPGTTGVTPGKHCSSASTNGG